MRTSHSQSESRSSDNGEITTRDRSTSNEDAVPEESKRATTEEESRQFSEPAGYRLQGIESKIYTKQTYAKENGPVKTKGYLSRDYRDLLNSAIDEAAGAVQAGFEPLPPSQIGASYWTSAEKERFFAAITSKGVHDLLGISTAIATKTEAEIRSYILLLEADCLSSNSDLSRSSGCRFTDVPAAHEIGEEAETVLDLAAESLDRHVLQHEVKAEKKKYGDHWLINEEVALEMEQQQAGLVSEDDISSSRSSEPSGPNPAAFHDSNAMIPSKYETDPAANATATPHPPIAIPQFASEILLRPETLLKLSRDLFMNGPPETDFNWRTHAADDHVSAEPAIFYSAYDDLGDFAVNLTRRLVKASIFQAVSRLRAKDDGHSIAVVTENDVKAAVELLNMKPEWKRYWSTVARRCGVLAYSDAEKFRDGRPGTKTGVQLSWEELEAELGFPRTSELPNSASGIPPDRSAQEANCSPAESSNEDSSADHESSPDSNDSDPSSADGLRNSKKRKLPSYILIDEEQEVEERNADVVDRQESRAEEQRLMEMLNCDISMGTTPERPETSEMQLKPRGLRNGTHSRWSKRARYEAEWEQLAGATVLHENL